MLKYADTLVSFQEVPDEISLCISITNCCNMCEGCHSPWLREDSGTPLTYIELTSLIKKNKGISCVCFMGGDREPWEVVRLATLVKEDFPALKTAWYSGNNDSKYKYSFDYVKLGPYIKELGPITEKTTNQRMYMMLPDGEDRKHVLDITYKFWK